MEDYVLIVEDSPVIRELCLKQLEKCGFTVHTVEKESDALTAASSRDYAFIVIGGKLLEGNSFSTARSIRAAEQLSGRYTPIIGLADNRDGCIAAGIDDYVPKPLSISAFQLTINRWLSYNFGRRSSTTCGATV